jgi:hypothetical protein
VAPLAASGVAATARPKRNSTMTREEQNYADYLAAQKQRGEVLYFDFEPVKLKIAYSETVQPDGTVKTTSTYYEPDFLVVTKQGNLEIREIKGTTYKTRASGQRVPVPFVEDDALVKIKVAASLFPFRFVIVHPLKSGEWAEIDFGSLSTAA